MTEHDKEYHPSERTEPVVSYAQNGEDIVLLRVLGNIEGGRYVDVGANDPIVDSVTYLFYKRGWAGITIEPVHDFAERLREARPRDVVVEAAISDIDASETILHEVADTGLSSVLDDVGEAHRAAGWAVSDITVPVRRLDDVLEENGWEGLDIHFVVIDTEGSEPAVLQSFDLRRWRPWVLVIEATRPQSTEQTHHVWERYVLDSGYYFCLFDGLSRFYVAREHKNELADALSYPASVFDNFETDSVQQLRERADELLQETDRQQKELAELRIRVGELTEERNALERELGEAVRLEKEAVATALQWRTKAIDAWAQSSIGSADREELLFLREHAHALFTELDALKNTVSWRVTAPLRSVRRVVPRRTP
jgi:FkbM family methyltransferase